MLLYHVPASFRDRSAMPLATRSIRAMRMDLLDVVEISEEVGEHAMQTVFLTTEEAVESGPLGLGVIDVHLEIVKSERETANEGVVRFDFAGDLID